MSKISLVQLPFKMSGLEPAISRETLQYHWGHHHQAYVNKTNKLMEELGVEDFESIFNLSGSDDPKVQQLIDNASQVRNHDLYWSTLAPSSSRGIPSVEMLTCIKKCFQSLNGFKRAVHEAGMGVMGSGWVWVVWSPETESTEVVVTKDAETVLNNVLFVIDVWEHAYYVDTPADRSTYLDNIWTVLNWNVINDRFTNRQR